GPAQAGRARRDAPQPLRALAPAAPPPWVRVICNEGPVFLIPWYVTLCVAQGVLVAIPAVGRDSTTRRGALFGLLGPAAAMVIGVGLVALLGGAGASLLTWLGTVATPGLAGSLGWIARWRWPPATAGAAAGRHVAAW